ncbi:MAG: hypothetical protein KTR15_05100 [Phycisphaeraceae bacterium]|nr:hypothetical protein [Phycisphaeraceae bacterium]
MKQRLLFTACLILLVGCTSPQSQVEEPDSAKAIWFAGDATSAITVLSNRISVEEYEVRLLAEDALRRAGKESIPALIAHIDNPDLSWRWNESVGDICRWKLYEKVVLISGRYKGRFTQDDEMIAPPDYLRDEACGGQITTENLERWWESVKHLSLEEIQLVALDWHIQSELEAGFTDDEQRAWVMPELLAKRKWLAEKIEQQ